jgi:hypothetical protein
MAILDGLKNAVAANVARSANNVAVNGLHSLVGDVFGVDLSTNPAGKLTNRPTKWTTKSLAYPAGVEGDDMQGHYIIFEILTQNKAKLTAAKNKKDALAAVVASETDRSATLASMTSAQKKANEAVKNYNDIASKKTDDGIRSLSGGKNSIQLSNKATVKIDTQIALYMPPSISVQYESKYGDQNISGIAAAAAGAIDAFTGKNGTSAETALKGALDELGMGLETGLMKVLETAAPGATALLALEKGAVRTPKMELMFEGIGRREFSYEFTFIPKDADEAKTIEDIVYEFKYHMASNYTDTTFREMEIPSFFNIRYMYRADENPFLNKISTCALEGMDVSYGGDRFVSYEGGRPQTTKISLKFKEMEIITKDQIDKGF